MPKKVEIDKDKKPPLNTKQIKPKPKKKEEEKEKTKLTDEENKELTKWAKTHGYSITKSRTGQISIKIKRKDDKIWTAEDLKVIRKFVEEEAPKLKLGNVLAYYHRERGSRYAGSPLFDRIYGSDVGLVNKDWFIYKDADTIKKEKDELNKQDAKNKAEKEKKKKQDDPYDLKKLSLKQLQDRVVKRNKEKNNQGFIRKDQTKKELIKSLTLSYDNDKK